MIRIMLSASLAISAASASAAERRYTVTDFDRIQIDGPFEVALTTGRASSARATGSNAAIDRLAIDVQGRTLRVRASRSAWGGYPGEGGGPVKIELGTHALRSASLNGSAHLAVDKMQAMKLDVAVSGSGRITVAAAEADTLALGLLGSGRISIGGRAKNVRATIQGSGDLDAERLTAEDCNIQAETSGSIAIGIRRIAAVTSSGGGDVKIVGSPACTVKQLGSGQVLCGKSNQR